MSSAQIAEALDVIEHVCASLIARLIVRSVRPLDLQRREEALYRRIVPTIPTSAHTAGDAVFGSKTQSSGATSFSACD
jgi:hypothetical protein